MSKSDVKKHVKTLCERYNIDFSVFLTSYGERLTYPRIKMSTKSSVNRQIHRYAIKYIESCRQYIMWDLSSNVGYTLSVSAKDVESAIKNKETAIKKAVQYPTMGHEIVSVYNEEELAHFIKYQEKVKN